MAAATNKQSTNERNLLQAGYRYAISLTHDKHSAEDLAQQAWFTIIKRYDKVENQAILYTAIKNHFTTSAVEIKSSNLSQ